MHVTQLFNFFVKDFKIMASHIYYTLAIVFVRMLLSMPPTMECLRNIFKSWIDGFFKPFNFTSKYLLHHYIPSIFNFKQAVFGHQYFPYSYYQVCLSQTLISFPISSKFCHLSSVFYSCLRDIHFLSAQRGLFFPNK